MNMYFRGRYFFLLFLGIGIIIFGSASAFMMQSGNYRMDIDDSSSSGGEWESVNYIFKDTMGEISTGRSSSDLYSLRAGYQEMNEIYISVSAPDDVILDGVISGISGGNASANVLWAVATDNSAGFQMQTKASTNPAMKLSGDATYYFDDYPTQVSNIPDYDWSVSSNTAAFGFTVEPETASDAVQNFLDNSSDACNQALGSETANKCWLGFNGDNYINVINRSTRTDIDGENEIIKFKADSQAKFLKSGNYTAEVTVLVASN